MDVTQSNSMPNYLFERSLGSMIEKLDNVVDALQDTSNIKTKEGKMRVTGLADDKFNIDMVGLTEKVNAAKMKPLKDKDEKKQKEIDALGELSKKITDVNKFLGSENGKRSGIMASFNVKTYTTTSVPGGEILEAHIDPEASIREHTISVEQLAKSSNFKSKTFIASKISSNLLTGTLRIKKDGKIITNEDIDLVQNKIHLGEIRDIGVLEFNNSTVQNIFDAISSLGIFKVERVNCDNITGQFAYTIHYNGTENITFEDDSGGNLVKELFDVNSLSWTKEEIDSHDNYITPGYVGLTDALFEEDKTVHVSIYSDSNFQEKVDGFVYTAKSTENNTYQTLITQMSNNGYTAETIESTSDAGKYIIRFTKGGVDYYIKLETDLFISSSENNLIGGENIANIITSSSEIYSSSVGTYYFNGLRIYGSTIDITKQGTLDQIVAEINTKFNASADFKECHAEKILDQSSNSWKIQIYYKNPTTKVRSSLGDVTYVSSTRVDDIFKSVTDYAILNPVLLESHANDDQVFDTTNYRYDIIVKHGSDTTYQSIYKGTGTYTYTEFKDWLNNILTMSGNDWLQGAQLIETVDPNDTSKTYLSIKKGDDYNYQVAIVRISDPLSGDHSGAKYLNMTTVPLNEKLKSNNVVARAYVNKKYDTFRGVVTKEFDSRYDPLGISGKIGLQAVDVNTGYAKNEMSLEILATDNLDDICKKINENPDFGIEAVVRSVSKLDVGTRNVHTGYYLDIVTLDSNKDYLKIIKKDDTSTNVIEKLEIGTGDVAEINGKEIFEVTKDHQIMQSLVIHPQALRCTIDGVEIERKDNDVNAIKGIKMTMVRVGETVLNVQPDIQQIQDNMVEFIKKYNDLIDFVNVQREYKLTTDENGNPVYKDGDGAYLRQNKFFKQIVATLTDVPREFAGSLKLVTDLEKIHFNEDNTNKKIRWLAELGIEMVQKSLDGDQMEFDKLNLVDPQRFINCLTTNAENFANFMQVFVDLNGASVGSCSGNFVKELEDHPLSVILKRQPLSGGNGNEIYLEKFQEKYNYNNKVFVMSSMKKDKTFDWSKFVLKISKKSSDGTVHDENFIFKDDAAASPPFVANSTPEKFVEYFNAKYGDTLTSKNKGFFAELVDDPYDATRARVVIHYGNASLSESTDIKVQVLKMSDNDEVSGIFQGLNLSRKFSDYEISTKFLPRFVPQSVDGEMKNVPNTIDITKFKIVKHDKTVELKSDGTFEEQDTQKDILINPSPGKTEMTLQEIVEYINNLKPDSMNLEKNEIYARLVPNPRNESEAQILIYRGQNERGYIEIVPLVDTDTSQQDYINQIFDRKTKTSDTRDDIFNIENIMDVRSDATIKLGRNAGFFSISQEGTSIDGSRIKIMNAQVDVTDLTELSNGKRIRFLPSFVGSMVSSFGSIKSSKILDIAKRELMDDKSRIRSEIDRKERFLAQQLEQISQKAAQSEAQRATAKQQLKTLQSMIKSSHSDN